MRVTLNVAFTVVLLAAAQTAAAQVISPLGNSQPGIATLFAHDPLTQSFCLRDGGPGLVFQAGQKRNRCSDLNFESYNQNSFTVGIEGARQGVILDLGTGQELKAKYGFEETVGGGQGFASIRIRNNQAMILKNSKTGELQEIAESAKLFGQPSRPDTSAKIKVGNIYLIRITDPNDKNFELVAKLIVLSFVPGVSVTIRWHLLLDRETAKL